MKSVDFGVQEAKGLIQWRPCDEDEIFIFKTKCVTWKLRAGFNLNDAFEKEYLTIEIECSKENESTTIWKTRAIIRLYIANRYIFGSEMIDYDFNNFDNSVKFEKIMNILSCHSHQLTKDHAELKLSITIIHLSTDVGGDLEVSAFMKRMWFSSPIVIRVGGHKLYAGRNELVHSPVFQKMLSGTETKEIEIKDICLEHVVDLLRYMHNPLLVTITKKNVEPLLKSAKTYNVQFLLEGCEKYLISTNEVSVSDKLRIAEVNSLYELQNKTVEKLTMDNIEKLLDMKISSAQELLEMYDYFDRSDSDKSDIMTQLSRLDIGSN